LGVTDWKTIAWNGVRFAVPGDWEPARVGRRHLVLESDPGPVMEIKWSTPRGRFSARRPLRALSGRVGRTGAVFQKTELAETWRAAAAGYEAEGFQWEAGRERAAGVLLHCPTCRTVSLIQFLERSGAGSIARTAPRILASFRDHRDDGRVAWALYDIATLLPGHFALGRQRFEAGRFVLEFKGGGRRLALYRWAPAEVLLRNRSLADFAETITGETKLPFRFLTIAGHPAVEGSDPLPLGRGGRLRMRLGMSWFRRMRLWRVAERNRILGVRLEGRRPIDDADMDDVSSGYGLAGEKALDTDADPP
jgi:hypothetical protein